MEDTSYDVEMTEEWDVDFEDPILTKHASYGEYLKVFTTKKLVHHFHIKL